MMFDWLENLLSIHDAASDDNKRHAALLEKEVSLDKIRQQEAEDKAIERARAKVRSMNRDVEMSSVYSYGGMLSSIANDYDSRFSRFARDRRSRYRSRSVPYSSRYYSDSSTSSMLADTMLLDSSSMDAGSSTSSCDAGSGFDSYSSCCDTGSFDCGGF